VLERMLRGQQHAYAPGIAHYRRPDFEQLDAVRCRAGAFELGALQCQTAQLDHQRVGQPRQQQTQLVALEFVATGAPPKQVELCWRLA
jgi:hypothetical protein